MCLCDGVGVYIDFILMIFNKTIFNDNSISRINLPFTIEQVSLTHTPSSSFIKVYFVLMVTYDPCDWFKKRKKKNSSNEGRMYRHEFQANYQICISILIGKSELNNYLIPCVDPNPMSEKQIIEMMRTPTHPSIVFTLHHLWSILLASCEISYLMK